MHSITGVTDDDLKFWLCCTASDLCGIEELGVIDNNQHLPRKIPIPLFSGLTSIFPRKFPLFISRISQRHDTSAGPVTRWTASDLFSTDKLGAIESPKLLPLTTPAPARKFSDSRTHIKFFCGLFLLLSVLYYYVKACRKKQQAKLSKFSGPSTGNVDTKEVVTSNIDSYYTPEDSHSATIRREPSVRLDASWYRKSLGLCG